MLMNQVEADRKAASASHYCGGCAMWKSAAACSVNYFKQTHHPGAQSKHDSSSSQ